MATNKLTIIILFLLMLLPQSLSAEERKLLEDFSVDLKDPIAYLEIELKERPGDYKLHFILGALYFELGTPTIIVSDDNKKKKFSGDLYFLNKAEEEFRKALEINKNDALSCYYLGLLSMQKGITNQAINYLQQAIEKDRFNERAYKKLHILYLTTKSYDEAIKLLDGAKSIFRDVEIYHRLGLTYMFKGDYENVIKNAKIAISIQKNSESQILLASAYSLTGKYDDAQKELEDILNTDPKNKTALFGLSVVFSKTGKKEKAIEILKKALGYYPDDSEIKKQLEEVGK